MAAEGPEGGAVKHPQSVPLIIKPASVNPIPAEASQSAMRA